MLANDNNINIETIISLTAEEKTALDVILEKRSVDILCTEHETSPIKGVYSGDGSNMLARYTIAHRQYPLFTPST